MKTIISIITILLSGYTQAQTAPITQDFESFENWSTAEAGEMPDYWDGFNRVIEFGGMQVGDVICIQKDSLDAKEGNYAVEITSESILGGPAVPGLFTTGDLLIDFNTQSGDIIGGEAFSNTPTHFNGWFKYQPAGIDTAFVAISFLSNGVEIFESQFTMDSTTSAWTEFSIPLTFPTGITPDSVNIVFASTSYTDNIPAGSKLTIDAIEFQYQTADIQTLKKDSNINIYPNPAADFITIENNFESIKEVRILDVLGHEIHYSKINTIKQTIDTSNFLEGIYYAEVTTESSKTIHTIKIN